MIIPPLPCVGAGIQHRGPSALPQTGQQGPSQANATMGSPFVIAEVLRPSTYKLDTVDGEVFTNAWNIEQLRRFYP
jgi:hypothetical protein